MHLPDNTLLQGGKYRIVRFIASGGFGCTYEAEHTTLHKRVAIKEFFAKDFCNRDTANNTISAGVTDKQPLVNKLREKFRQEAIAVSQLQHDHIVSVHDVFDENGTSYYVMDYIDGMSMSEYVKRHGRLDSDEAVAIIQQIADALGYVHSQNRLHLDVKPGNIMRQRDGKGILIDFGVSKQYDEANGENTSSMLGFSRGYAPLEQTSATVRKFTPPTDVYALAATLYFMLIGSAPVDAATIATEGLEYPDGVVDQSLRRVIDKAMSLRVADRYQTMAEFADALSKATTAREVTTKPTAPVTVEPNPSSHSDDTLIDGRTDYPTDRPKVTQIKPKDKNRRPAYVFWMIIGYMFLLIATMMVMRFTPGMPLVKQLFVTGFIISIPMVCWGIGVYLRNKALGIHRNSLYTLFNGVACGLGIVFMLISLPQLLGLFKTGFVSKTNFCLSFIFMAMTIYGIAMLLANIKYSQVVIALGAVGCFYESLSYLPATIVFAYLVYSIIVSIAESRSKSRKFAFFSRESLSLILITATYFFFVAFRIYDMIR